MKPKVSVIIPARIGSDNLRLAIDSIVAQTYENIEIIIVSDALSTDGVIEKNVKSYGGKVRSYKKDGDIATALNFGIGKATGQYFSWLLPGDTYNQDKIEKQVESIGDAVDTIVVSEWTTVTTGGKKAQSHLTSSKLEQFPGCFLAFARQTPLNTRAMLIPMEVAGSMTLFNKSIPCSWDYKMLNRLLEAGASFKIVSESLLCLGPHPQQESLIDTTAREYDFICSGIVETLNYVDIINYFGDKEQAISYYKDILDAELPRTAAFLMSKIIRGSMIVDDHDSTKAVLLEDLSMLSEDQMATSADTLLSVMAKSPNKKRILFCTTHWLTGGMERVLINLFKELQNDFEIFLITPYDERKSYIDVPDFVTSIKISNELFLKHFDSLILSYALLLDIDVVIGFVNLFRKQLNFYELCVGTKIKTIASSHEYYFYPYKSPDHYEVVEKRLTAFATCDALVWPNNFSAALCGMYVDNNYVIGNPNGFEVMSKTKLPQEKIIICVGRFNDYVKRIDRILECFSLILKKTPDAKLVLVGKYDNDAPIRPNDRTTVNNLIDELGIPRESLNFVGETNNLQEYYSDARVLMLTSNSEGFGMVLNEAACFGVPSVCNYIPGIEDIITDGENGYITEQDDITSMALRVDELLNNDELQKKLSSNAKKRVVAYDSKHIGDKWRYLMSSLVETEDPDKLRKILNNELGYKVENQQLLKVVSSELSEIFYMSISEAAQRDNADIVSKVIRIPAKIRANIEYEGWIKTGSKLVTRSYNKARNVLRI